MNNFAAYSAYYDLLYRDKDYGAEAAYVKSNLTRATNIEIKSILELGCGTGKHAEILVNEGLSVLGVDISETMVEQAKLRLNGNKSARFEHGDVRAIRINEQFDAVISLFHVASYQVTNQDIAAFLLTAARHLKPRGVFLFDFWYGPAVHKQQPAVRIKRMENSEFRVVRLTEPEHNINECTVDVNFEVHVTAKADERLNIIRELHKMRYFFLPELTSLLEQAGFDGSTIHYEEWLTKRVPSEFTWGVTAVALKK